MNTMYTNNQFYPNAFNPGGMIPNTQQIPNTGNWLTPEQYAMLKKADNQFNLAVSEQTNLKSMCNHRFKETNTFALIPDSDGTDGYTCALCGEHFHSHEFSQDDVETTTHNMTDILNTIKIMYLSIDPEAAKEYFQIMGFIEKVPQLYKIAVDDFKKYEGISTFTPTQSQSPFQLFGMMTNPAPFQQQPMGYYQAPQMAPMTMTPQPMMQGYGQPQAAPYGYNPLYGQPQPTYQPQPAYQPQPGYQPQGNGYAFNPQGAAQPGMVNTNMPVQPQQPIAPAATPAVTEEPVKVDTNFKK